MDTPGKDKQPDKEKIPAELRGETIAYAVQSGFYNIAANFFEPYINYRTQKYYSKHDRRHRDYGNYTQNLAGEFAGDLIGCGSLIFAEALFPLQLHTTSRRVRGWVDPLYSSVAQNLYASEKDEPDYQQTIEKWKTYQERNLVRSSIMAIANIAGNVLTQKTFIGNPAPASVIFKGKLLSTALTTACGLSSRLIFPSQMRAMDKWIGQSFFTSMFDDKVIPAERDDDASHTDRLQTGNDGRPAGPAQ